MYADSIVARGLGHASRVLAPHIDACRWPFWLKHFWDFVLSPPSCVSAVGDSAVAILAADFGNFRTFIVDFDDFFKDRSATPTGSAQLLGSSVARYDTAENQGII